MSIPGWKPWYSNWEQPRPENSDRALASALEPEVMEEATLYRDVSAAASRRDTRTTPERYLARMAVRNGNKIVLISMSDVLWIQSYGNLVRLHLENASYEHRTTITNAYTHLDPQRFVRVHRNAIVNLDHVREFDLPRSGNAFVHLSNGKALPITRTARLALRRGLLSQSYGSTNITDV